METTEKTTWETPTAIQIRVSAEVTAYAGIEAE